MAIATRVLTVNNLVPCDLFTGDLRNIFLGFD